VRIDLRRRKTIAVVKLNPAGTAVIYTAAFSGSKYSASY
jgi:hypothetical protein